jgi:hypothetical protein
MNRFAIDESKLAHWLDTELSGAGELDIDPTWNPQDYGQETSVYDLVRQAHGQVIIPPQDMRVSFCYRDDSDGGCYCWLVDIAAGLHGLRLASAFEEMRRLVPDERVGREAAESILREAVEQANGCLAALVRHTGLRGAAETDAVIAETTIERSITPEPDGDDAGWLAGVADGLAWVLGQDASDDMRRLARAALARAGDQAIAANSQPRPGLDVATLAPAQQTADLKDPADSQRETQ